MTTSDQGSVTGGRGPTPEDVRRVQFTHATMLHPGYTETEVDGFLAHVADELSRLGAENAELRAQLRELQARVQHAEARVQQAEARAHEVEARPSPSDQAVGILATAQLTADEYVAEAEEFSRQMTSEARSQYEEQLGQAREKAGAIIQAAQEAAMRVAAGGGGGRASDAGPDTEELQAQVAYLKAFGQAVRVQLRSYLEALINDVETEWGRAHPAALPQGPLGPRLAGDDAERGAATFHSNAATDVPATDGAAVPEAQPARSS